MTGFEMTPTDTDSKPKMRYVVAYDLGDGWPVVFRPDCELTYHGEGLAEMIARLHKAGYGIYDRPYDFEAKVWW